VEADETFFRESFKGTRTANMPRPSKKRGTKAKKRGLSKEQIPVLVARDRTGKATLSKVIPSRSAKDIQAVLTGHIASDAVLCSDGYKAYKSVAKNLGVDCKVAPPTPKGTPKPTPAKKGKKAKKKKPLVFHIQNVNGYHKQLHQWMDRFNGVATKYLDNYMGWHRWLETNKSAQKAKGFLSSSLG
jgi:hypothetical protein